MSTRLSEDQESLEAVRFEMIHNTYFECQMLISVFLLIRNFVFSRKNFSTAQQSFCMEKKKLYIEICNRKKGLENLENP